MGTKSALASPSFLSMSEIARMPTWATSACLFAADLFALTAIYWIVVIGRYLVNSGYSLQLYLQTFPIIALFLIGFVIQGLYPGLLLHPGEELRRIFYCLTATFLLIASTTFLWRNGEWYSRSIFLVSWLCGAPAVFLCRVVIRSLLSRTSWWGVNAVVLGSGAAALRVASSLHKRNCGVRLRGVLTEDQYTSWSSTLPPILGSLAIAPLIAQKGIANYAIVALSDKSDMEIRHIIQDYCRGFRHILLVPDMPGISSLGVSAREVAGGIAIELPQRLLHITPMVVKRIFDVVLSVLALFVLLPVFLVVAIAIKLTSRGTILYCHPRYGRDGTLFNALKFRSMVQNADAVLRDHLCSHPADLVEWQRDHKLKCDPRVTRVGRWLRRVSLDELPQLFNVLVGEMSLVGPRPIVKAEILKYGRGYDLYTRVIPGITGLWQVSGRNNTTYEERVALDEHYVRNWSVWLDIYILAITIKVLLTTEGAY